MGRLGPLAALLLIAAAPGPNTVQCTANCVAPDGTTQPSGTNLNYVLCGSDACAAWVTAGALPANTALVTGAQGALYVPAGTGPARCTTNCAENADGTVNATALAASASAAGLATASALTALQAAMPVPLTTIPPAPTQTGAAGSGQVYIPANAAPPSLTRSTTAITASDGTVSITWTNPLVSATPPVSIIPINAGAQPVICNVTARTASTVAGKCWQVVSTTLSLAIVTAGLNLNPATSAAAGLSVMIVARETSP